MPWASASLSLCEMGRIAAEVPTAVNAIIAENTKMTAMIAPITLIDFVFFFMMNSPFCFMIVISFFRETDVVPLTVSVS